MTSNPTITFGKQKKWTEKIFGSFKGYRKHYELTLMFLPVILYFLVFKYGPMYGVIIAFKNYNIKLGIMKSEWIGFANFAFIFKQPTFLRAVKNTLIISLLKLAAGFPMPIILAILLNEVRSLKFKKITQTISYLPHFLSWVILSGIFMQLLSPSSGAVNYILGLFGIEPIYFMANNLWFRPILILTTIWKDMGWGSIIYIAGIAGISPSLYEAAVCDGANRFQKIIHITIPALAPTITVLLILNVGRMMDAGFDQIFNLYNASVYQSADIIDTYVYRMGLGNMQYSMATAVGLFKNIIALILVVSTNAISKKINEYGLW